MTSHLPERRVSVVVLILALALAAACSSSNPTSPGSTPAVNTSSTTSPGGGGTGSLKVMLKDSPFSEATAVLVTFSGVSVHMAGGDWVTLPFSPASMTRTCDLKKLQGPQDVLGIGTLAAGHYTQIRLMVESAKIYQGGVQVADPAPCAADAATLVPTADGGPEVVVSDVVVPSGEIKLNREFDVPSGGATMIVLDFDGDKSINQTGNGKYMMKPVIGIVSVTVE